MNGRSFKWLLASVLALYSGSLFGFVLILQMSAEAQEGSGSEQPLLLAEAGALARVQFAARVFRGGEFAGWFDAPISDVFRQFHPSRPEELVWLGETGQFEELERKLGQVAPWAPWKGVLRRIYLEPGLSAREPSTSELPEVRGFFREALLARVHPAPGAVELLERAKFALFLVGALVALVGGLGLLGALVFLTGWLWLERVHPRHRFLPPEPGSWTLLDVVLGFFGWFSCYLTISLGSNFLPLEQASRWMIASMALVYLAQAVCGWFILRGALRPGSSSSQFFRGLAFGSERLGFWRTLLFAVGGYAMALPCVYGAESLAQWLSDSLPTSSNPMIGLILDTDSWGEKALLLLTVAGLAPCFEELLFRGILMPALRSRLGAAGAILLSAIVFGAVHLDPATFPPLVLLGCLLGWVAHRGGGLLPAILLHAIWNAQSFLQLEVLRVLR